MISYTDLLQNESTVRHICLKQFYWSGDYNTQKPLQFSISEPTTKPKKKKQLILLELNHKIENDFIFLSFSTFDQNIKEKFVVIETSCQCDSLLRGHVMYVPSRTEAISEEMVQFKRRRDY